MGSLREALSVIASLAVAFVVPGIVWAMLVVGVCQLARDDIRRVFPLPRTARLTKVGEGRQAS